MTVSETYIVCCAGLNYSCRPVRLREFRATDTKMMSPLVHSIKLYYLKHFNGQHLLNSSMALLFGYYEPCELTDSINNGFCSY